ncbi:MAG: hypothetical protein ACI857_002812 [Arenicella sp.]|jgi:hypothetical protein
MKKIILASLSLLCGLVSFSQGTHSETRSITKNGLTKTWKITKEFDARGNMIDYDSTFVEGPVDESQFENFGKDFSNEGFGDFGDFGSKDFGSKDFGSSDFGDMNMDSIRSDMNSMMSSMMQEMQTMMRGMTQGMDMDDMFNNMPQMDGLSPTPQDNRIIVPGHQKSNSPKGTRI